MFDVLTIAALRDEIAERLLGGRVQKVVQAGALTLAMEVYAGQRSAILASADPTDPYLLVAQRAPAADPEQVSPFLLLVRKYVRGSRLVDVEQPPLERILWLTFEQFFADERREPAEGERRGTVVRTRLAVELMGRHSNLILVGEDGRVLDAIKRVTPSMSSVRPILPGRSYQPPPPQVKRDPRLVTPEGIRASAQEARPETELPVLLVQALAGFSPQMAREVVYRACGSFAVTARDVVEQPDLPQRLASAVHDAVAPLERGDWEPTVYVSEGQAVAFAAIRLSYLAGTTVETYPSMSAAIERFLSERGPAEADVTDRYARRRQRLLEHVEEARDRAEVRLRALEQEAQRGQDAERWRQMGEAIYASLAWIEPGQTELEVEGWRIPLDPTLSPSENAQVYFDRYRKAKAAAEQLPPLIEEARRTLAYLDQLLVMVRLAETAEELEHLRQEWEHDAVPQDSHRRQRKGGARALAFRRPRAWLSPRGDRIYVGRHGRENDVITFEVARPDDAWLHARGVPGAHVVVQWAGPEDPAVLESAAALAAWYSGARGSTRVPVDVTRRRFVRRIPGAGPGLVQYRNERTLHVRPQRPEMLGLQQG